MNPAAQLLAEQPAVFWLAAGAGVLAGGVAAGARTLSRAAAAGPLAALAGGALPASPGVQAAVFVLAGAALSASALRRPRPAATPPAAPVRQGVDPRLLGRTVRALDFAGGRGFVAVDGARLPAALASGDGPTPARGALLRVVRVGDGELAVRPLQVD